MFQETSSRYMYNFVNDTFLYTGQSTKQWPKWLLFCNFATDHEKIVIPYLWHCVVIHRGDLVLLDEVNEVHAIPPSEEDIWAKALALKGATR